MATSGSKSVTVTSWDTLKFTWSTSSQSVDNNTSTVYWVLQLVSGSSGRIDSTASKKWSVTVNGTTYSGTNTVGIANNTTKTLASGTTTISHNADGTKTFSYSFSQEFSITFSGSTIGTKSGSGSGTLNTIPRKSTLSASNGTLGTAQTLTVTRQSTSFTHTITYKCGSASGTVCTKSSSTSISFTPPLSLAAQNTTGTSVSIVFTITTYNGSTSIGTATKTISCAIPASVKPTVSIAVSDPTGYAETFGAYVQSKSKIKVVVTASGAQGSTIKAYKTTANGGTYTAAEFTTAVITSSGTLTVFTTVTDSRGRTATAATNISVTAYSAPSIGAFSIIRCNADGTANTSGAYMAVKFNANITELSGNTAEYVVKYKKTTETEYTTETLTEYSGQYTVSDGVFIFAAAVSSTYNVVLSVSDYFGSAQKTGKGSSVFKVWSIFKEGLGIALGKIAELSGVFDIGFVTKFSGGIQNEVLEKITDLNDVSIPNTYVSINQGASSYANCPIASGTFVLEVMSAGAEGQVFQRLTTTFKDGLQETYERHYFQSAWGAWSCTNSDTGWLGLELQSGVSYGSEMGYLKGRRKNGVLYIKGDVIGISANWKYFAHVPDSLLSGLPSSTRFGGVYNMSYFCGMNLINNGQLYVSINSTGSWDETKNTTINVAICI